MTADEAHRRSEEAVRRIREESRRRVLRRRHRSCFSWCMLASLVGGLSLAGMDAYDARLNRAAEATAAQQAATEQKRVEDGLAAEAEQRLQARVRAETERDERDKALIREQYESARAVLGAAAKRGRKRGRWTHCHWDRWRGGDPLETR